MQLLFLKLGGSLITDKTRPFTPRLDKLDSLASEIASAISKKPDLQLVLGHGSGSFGHAAAHRYGTRLGVSTPEAWRGFAEVWYQASTLNRLVVDALHRKGLPAVTFSPLSNATARDGKVFAWDPSPIQAALSNGLLPVIHGDVVFDNTRGGTILSTEDLFTYLAHNLHPDAILLAGLENGVWADFPDRENLLGVITPDDILSLASHLGPANGTDVTGGMYSKVAGMLALVKQLPDLQIWIFSGEHFGNIQRALLGHNTGTCLHR